MNRRGFTVMELAVGMATAAVLAMVSAALFRAGILTYNYMSSQNKAMAAAIKALNGDGSRDGVMRAARGAKSVSNLSATTPVVVSTSGVTTTYNFSGSKLTFTQSGVTRLLTNDISTMSITYYNMNTATGRLIQSTAAASASFVAAQVGTYGKTGTQKSYYFYSGAFLRNHE